MATKRTVKISETAATLRMLEESHHGSSRGDRLHFLRLLKEDGGMTLAEAATRVNCSERTAKRWWRLYLREGLEGLLRVRGGSVEGTRSTNETPRTDRFTEPLIDRAERTSTIDVLNALPTSHVLSEWIVAFRSLLQQLIGFVDRIIITVNLECDLQAPDEYRPSLHITEYIRDTPSSDRSVRAGHIHSDEPHRNVIRELGVRGFPLDNFHPPHGSSYYLKRNAYLGAILLFRERTKPPISHEMVELLDRLDPFIRFMLSDCVARQQTARPVDRAFSTALEEISRDFQLTVAERRILVLRLTGQRYAQIAESACVSVETVRSHLKAIHRKTGVSNLTELFARYFTPRSDE